MSRNGDVVIRMLFLMPELWNTITSHLIRYQFIWPLLYCLIIVISQNINNYVGLYNHARSDFTFRKFESKCSRCQSFWYLEVNKWKFFDQNTNCKLQCKSSTSNQKMFCLHMTDFVRSVYKFVNHEWIQANSLLYYCHYKSSRTLPLNSCSKDIFVLLKWKPSSLTFYNGYNCLIW